MKLSYRDKLLLVVMTIIITLAAGYMLVIKGKISDIETNRETLSTQQEVRDQIQADIDRLPELQLALQQRFAESNDLANTFFDDESALVADRYIRKILADDKIKISSLNIGDFSSATLDYYSYSTPQVSYPAGDMANDIANTTGTGAVVAVQGETLGSRAITINYSGSIDDLRKFLDRMIYSAEHPSLVVDNMTCTSLSNKDLTGTISMTMYYVKRLPNQIQ